MLTTCYLQIEPEFTRWKRPDGKPNLGAVHVRRVTQKRPTSPLPGVIVVKLNLNIADAAFMPLEPEATIEIPVDHTQAVEVATEPLEVPE